MNVVLADALLSLSLHGGWMFPAARWQEVVGVHGLGISSFSFCFVDIVRCCSTDCFTEDRKISFLQQPKFLYEIGNLGSCCGSSKKAVLVIGI